MQALTRPLTIDEMKTDATPDGRIGGTIQMPLEDVVNTGDAQLFAAELSERLTGTTMLEDVGYILAGSGDTNTLLIHVTGDATAILNAFDHNENGELKSFIVRPHSIILEALSEDDAVKTVMRDMQERLTAHMFKDIHDFADVSEHHS